MQIKKIEVEGWRAELVVDEDNHLAVYIKHVDGSEVHACDADIGGIKEWGERFTTEKIEEAYTKSIPTLKRMTRQEVINALVNLIMDERVYQEEDIPDILRYGHRGYQKYTDQELLEEYVNNFEDELGNTRVEIVPAECKESPVQKKG